MNRRAAILFVHFAAAEQPAENQAMIIGAAAIAFGIKPMHYVALIGTGAVSKYFAEGIHANIGEIASTCAKGGLIASALYTLYAFMHDKDE